MSIPPPPIPAQTLAYQTPVLQQRPGVVTALGILSIIIGSLGALNSCFSTAGGIGMIFLSNIKIPMPALPTTLPNSSGAVTVGGVPDSPGDTDDGIASAQQEIVLRALQSKQPLSQKQLNHLRLLLETHGSNVFPLIVPSTKQQILANISDSGHDRETTYFVVGAGRLEITSQQATFRPTTGDVITASSSLETTVPVRVSNRTIPAPIFSFKFSKPMFILTISSGIMNLVLAGLLLTAGILVFRNSARALSLHWTYIFLKIPIVLLAAVVTYLVYSQMMSNFATTPGMATAGSPTLTGISQAVVSSGISLAYPIALIVMLSLDTTKRYFRALSPGGLT